MVKKTITIGGVLFDVCRFHTASATHNNIGLASVLDSLQCPQTFGFEDDLNSVDSVYGTPIPVVSPAASEGKAIECQNGDYIRWNLLPPSKTIDLSFKTYWTKFPTIANESLVVGEIFGSISESGTTSSSQHFTVTQTVTEDGVFGPE